LQQYSLVPKLCFIVWTLTLRNSLGLRVFSKKTYLKNVTFWTQQRQAFVSFWFMIANWKESFKNLYKLHNYAQLKKNLRHFKKFFDLEGLSNKRVSKTLNIWDKTNKSCNVKSINKSRLNKKYWKYLKMYQSYTSLWELCQLLELVIPQQNSCKKLHILDNNKNDNKLSLKKAIPNNRLERIKRV
jgi:hypothetical protein